MSTKTGFGTAPRGGAIRANLVRHGKIGRRMSAASFLGVFENVKQYQTIARKFLIYA
ncbi:hypothetical protein [Hoeflea sp.]|uniref:hypothetical protein n=1 Tax=Hoeflea sp. TaxID=1940281 RepID=UPI003A91FCA5